MEFTSANKFEQIRDLKNEQYLQLDSFYENWQSEVDYRHLLS